MPTKVHIGNLSWNTTDDHLRDAFSSCGAILDLIVVRNPKNGRSRGFGFVTFGSELEAQIAVTRLNKVELDGRRIKVSFARPRGPGGSGGEGHRGSGGYNGTFLRGHGGYNGGYGVSLGGYGRQGFQQYGYGGGGYIGRGSYHHACYRDGGYISKY